MIAWLVRHGNKPYESRAVILGAYNGVIIKAFAQAFLHLYVVDDGYSDYQCKEPVLGEVSNEAIDPADYERQPNVTMIIGAPEDSWTKRAIVGPVDFVFFQYHLSYVPLSRDMIWCSQLQEVKFVAGVLFGCTNSDVKRAVLGYHGVPDKIFDDYSWIKQIKA
jgi:hypothetical protein